MTMFSLSMVLPILASVLMHFYTVKSIPAWNARGFGDAGLNWRKTVISALALSLVAGVATALTSGGVLGFIMAVFAYFAVVAIATDLSVMKIPFGLSVVTYLAPLLTAPLWFSVADKFSLIAWAVLCVLMYLLALIRGGIGMADIRILFFALTGLSWWVGIMPLTYSLIVACILQIVLMLATQKSSAFGVSKVEGDATIIDSETKELRGEGVKEGKKKKHSPFGPALIISFMGASVYALVTHNDLLGAVLF